MKYFDWDEEKNAVIKSERDVSFEDVVIALEEGRLLDIVGHPNKIRYPNQKMFIININDYVYLVPFVEDDQKVFLKTVIPSRKATKKYLVEKKGGK